MLLNNMILGMKLICFAPAEEGAGGGGQGENTGAGDGEGVVLGGDTEGGDAGDTKTSDEDGVALDGGTAEGQDNSGEEGSDDKGGDDAEKDDEGDQTVPEEYEWNGLPEGMEVDTALAESVSPVFRELGLTQEQADKLTGAYAGAAQRQAEASAEAAVALVKGWKETAQQDEEIGGNNWDRSVAAANSFIRRFGSPELVSDLLKGQGVGNHPELIRIFARAGAAFSDDTFVSGEATDTGDKVSIEETWYGKTTPTSKKG